MYTFAAKIVHFMEIAGYIASVLIGISLGLIGGGGSILTLPVLVYLFGIDVYLATAYSLFIVGISSSVGSVFYYIKGLVNLKTAFIFGIPSIISIFLTRKFLLPVIPDIIFADSGTVISKNMMLLFLFALLMILSSYKMIQNKNASEQKNTMPKKNSGISAAKMGSIVGVLTGLVGAGGGFIIIPALVNLLKTPMKMAVGSSLFIISLNSLFGFFSVQNFVVDWRFLLTISAIAVLGVVVGWQLSKKNNGKKLKPAFGYFILVMGFYIIIKELFL